MSAGALLARLPEAPLPGKKVIDAALNLIGKIAAWLDCTRMAATHLRIEPALRDALG